MAKKPIVPKGKPASRTPLSKPSALSLAKPTTYKQRFAERMQQIDKGIYTYKKSYKGQSPRDKR